MQTGLAGKVVIVTAATANIGRGIALAFAAEGARVTITGRDPVAGELVAKLARDGVAADDHHPGALGGERQRDSPADVRGRGGDDDDLACQSRLHGLSSLSVGPLSKSRTVLVS